MERRAQPGVKRLIGVDTNVLIRLLTADDPDQHRNALAFFGQCSVDAPAFVSAVTIAETIWVLRTKYRYTHQEVLLTVSGLLDSDDFVIDGRIALEQMRIAGKPELLSDFLVAHLGQRAGCTHTVTFDRRAARGVPGMTLLA